MQLLGSAPLHNAGSILATGTSALNCPVLNDIGGLIRVNGNGLLYLYGPTVTNNGTIRSFETGGSGTSHLSNVGAITLQGTGDLFLADAINSVLETYSGTLTQAAGHTIHGVGTVTALLANAGTVQADAGLSQALVLSGNPKTNTGTMKSVGGSILRLSGVSVDNTGGVLSAAGGTVEITGSSIITAGTLSRTGSSVFENKGTGSLYNVTNNAELQLDGGSTTYLYTGMTNNGTLRLFQPGGSGITSLQNVGSLTLQGTGDVLLTNDVNSQLGTYSGTLTQAASHTIHGVGTVTALLANAGLVEADAGPAQALVLSTNNMTNTGNMKSVGGSVLRISGINVDNSGGGVISAEGGTVELVGAASITSGSLTRTGSSIFELKGVSSLHNVTNNAETQLDGGSTTYLYTGMTNNGTMRVFQSGGSGLASLQNVGALTLQGTGDVLLNDTVNSQLGTNSGTLTQAAGHTIHGVGNVTALLANAGLVQADAGSSQALVLSTNNKTNTGAMKSVGGSVLRISGINVDNTGGGVISAEGGTVELVGAASVTAGSFTRTGSSIVEIKGVSNLTNVVNNAELQLDGGSTTYLYSGMTDNGTLRVFQSGGLGAARLSHVGAQTLRGSGDVLLTDAANSFLDSNSGTLTQAAGHRIHGVGTVTALLANAGLVQADAGSAQALVLSSSNKTNTGTMKSVGGSVLRFSGVNVDNTGGGVISAEGGTVELVGATSITSGSFTRTGSSIVELKGVSSLYNVTNNAEMQLDGSSFTYIYGGITNNGIIRLFQSGGSGGAYLQNVSSATLQGTGELVLTNESNSQLGSNSGTFTHAAGHTIHGTGTISGTLVNQGLVQADSGFGHRLLSTGTFDNQGTVRATRASVFQFSTLPVNYAANRLTGGKWVAAPGCTLSFPGGAINTNAASITLDGPGSMLTNGAASALAGFALNDTAGTFTILHARNFTTSGSFTNHGKIVVDSGSVFTAGTGAGNSPSAALVDAARRRGLTDESITAGPSGDYTQDVGVLEVQIATSGLSGRLEAAGTAHLDGRLVVTRAQGFTAALGDSFVVVHAGTAVTGIFNHYENLLLPNGLWLNVIYRTNSVVLVVGPAPNVAAQDPQADTKRPLRFAASRVPSNGAGFDVELPANAVVEILVHDVSGRVVSRLNPTAFTAGRHQVTVETSPGGGMSAMSGIYFARLTARWPGHEESRIARLVLVH